MSLIVGGLGVVSVAVICYRQDGVEAKKRQAECLKKLGEVGLESGQCASVSLAPSGSRGYQ